MITVVSQDRKIILDVGHLEIDCNDGKYLICHVSKKSFKDFLCWRSMTYYPLAEYELLEDAQRVLKCCAAAIQNGFKTFIFPFDDMFYIQSCEEIYMSEDEKM